MDSEGRLYFRGRRKDVIVTLEGLNVSPDDVETELRRIPDIKDSAVVSIGDQVHAVLILRNPGSSREEIEEWIRRANERLESHQRIRNWSIWPQADFPRTSSTLKVKRGKIAARISTEPASQSDAVDPSAMSSLERVELLAALEERHGIEIDETAFSKATTVEDMKQFVEHPVAARTSPPLSSWPLSLPVRLLRGTFQRGFAIPLFRNRLPLTVIGIEHLAGIDPPVIFAANHASDLDAPAVFTALPSSWRKRLAPAIRADYFGSSWKLRLQYLLARSLYNGFALPQEMAGMRRTIEYIGELMRRGCCPLIFPEGRRTRNGTLQNFRPGIGMLAVRLQVPVIPIHIRGMYEIYSLHDTWPKTGPVRVSFGKPMWFSANTSFEEATKAIRSAIESMSSFIPG
jgi:long-chain acyl-CoA synthetase